MSDNVDLMLNVATKIARDDVLKKDFVYCPEESQFYVFDVGYWKRINKMEIMKLCLNYFDGHEIKKDHYALNIRGCTFSRRSQIFDNLAQLVYKDLKDFNKTGFLNFDQGEFDPITGVLHPHLMGNYSTLRMPYPYEPATVDGIENPDAKCKLWLKTLKDVFESDQEKIDILQEFFGYCLTKDTKQRKALLLIGESNCGKSTILWTLRHMLGDDNCSSVSMKNIVNPQYTANLINKLVNIDTDVSQDAKEYEESFKKIAGGEAVNCNSKYLAPFDYFPYSRICMGSNGFPRCSDHSDAFFNRLIIIPCDRVFNEEEQNKDLPVLLKAELSGIFNWAVQGLKRLNARGRFEIKDFMKEARQELRDESNPIDVFFRETVVVEKASGKSMVVKHELYNRYVEWCRINGNAHMSTIKFGKAVFQKFANVTEKKSQNHDGVYVWRNIKFKEKEIPEDQRKVDWDE